MNRCTRGRWRSGSRGHARGIILNTRATSVVEREGRKGRAHWRSRWRGRRRGWCRWCIGNSGTRRRWRWRRNMRHGGRCVGKYKKGDILNRKGRGSGTRIVRTRLIKGDIDCGRRYTLLVGYRMVNCIAVGHVSLKSLVFCRHGQCCQRIAVIVRATHGAI